MLVNEIKNVVKGDLIHQSKALTIFNILVSDSGDSGRQELLRYCIIACTGQAEGSAMRSLRTGGPDLSTHNHDLSSPGKDKARKGPRDFQHR